MNDNQIHEPHRAGRNNRQQRDNGPNSLNSLNSARLNRSENSYNDGVNVNNIVNERNSNQRSWQQFQNQANQFQLDTETHIPQDILMEMNELYQEEWMNKATIYYYEAFFHLAFLILIAILFVHIYVSDIPFYVCFIFAFIYDLFTILRTAIRIKIVDEQLKRPDQRHNNQNEKEAFILVYGKIKKKSMAILVEAWMSIIFKVFLMSAISSDTYSILLAGIVPLFFYFLARLFIYYMEKEAEDINSVVNFFITLFRLFLVLLTFSIGLKKLDSFDWSWKEVFWSYWILFSIMIGLSFGTILVTVGKTFQYCVNSITDYEIKGLAWVLMNVLNLTICGYFVALGVMDYLENDNLKFIEISAYVLYVYLILFFMMTLIWKNKIIKYLKSFIYFNPFQMAILKTRVYEIRQARMQRLHQFQNSSNQNSARNNNNNENNQNQEENNKRKSDEKTEEQLRNEIPRFLQKFSGTFFKKLDPKVNPHELIKKKKLEDEEKRKRKQEKKKQMEQEEKEKKEMKKEKKRKKEKKKEKDQKKEIKEEQPILKYNKFGHTRSISSINFTKPDSFLMDAETEFEFNHKVNHEKVNGNRNKKLSNKSKTFHKDDQKGKKQSRASRTQLVFEKELQNNKVYNQENQEIINFSSDSDGQVGEQKKSQQQYSSQKTIQHRSRQTTSRFNIGSNIMDNQNSKNNNINNSVHSLEDMAQSPQLQGSTSRQKRLFNLEIQTQSKIDHIDEIQIKGSENQQEIQQMNSQSQIDTIQTTLCDTEQSRRPLVGQHTQGIKLKLNFDQKNMDKIQSNIPSTNRYDYSQSTRMQSPSGSIIPLEYTEMKKKFQKNNNNNQINQSEQQQQDYVNSSEQLNFGTENYDMTERDPNIDIEQNIQQQQYQQQRRNKQQIVSIIDNPIYNEDASSNLNKSKEEEQKQEEKIQNISLIQEEDYIQNEQIQQKEQTYSNSSQQQLQDPSPQINKQAIIDAILNGRPQLEENRDKNYKHKRYLSYQQQDLANNLIVFDDESLQSSQQLTQQDHMSSKYTTDNNLQNMMGQSKQSKMSQSVIRNPDQSVMSQSVVNKSVANCLVCFDKLPDAVFMDCGHGGICYECSLELWKSTGECFLCRMDIRSVLQVDLSKKHGNFIKVLSSTQMVRQDVEVDEEDGDDEDNLQQLQNSIQEAQNEEDEQDQEEDNSENIQ